ncbi:MAG: DUF1295 domain-containing protein [Deltaproteobacteria bacterium]|nr:MAG: DUF1295 domain-containing protein [Deltaproteobacteria bacterium]
MVDHTTLVVVLFAVVAVQRWSEVWLSVRNGRWARARGAVEVGRRHYRFLVALHVAWILAFPAEALLRGQAPPPAVTALALAGFVVAQIFRYAAIVTLGRRWNTRILVLPGQPPIRRGIYRYLRHPNYVAVVLELACVPVAVGAYVTAAVVSAVNLLVLRFVRIPAEERALAEATRARPEPP